MMPPGLEQVLRLRLLFKERVVPVELLVAWAPDVPMPSVPVVIEAMLDGLLMGIDGEAVAWDDSCVEMMTVNLIPSLHMQVPDGQ
jgi:hypothetical protein